MLIHAIGSPAKDADALDSRQLAANSKQPKSVRNSKKDHLRELVKGADKMES